MPNSLTLFGYQGNNMLVKELNDEEAVLLEEILNMVRNHMRK